uniref:Peptidase S1 domain-containing protein n=1 Tax=Aotus nancymaae TaxID=37293 RepID=A0A2K5CDU4_AOTNA
MGVRGALLLALLLALGGLGKPGELGALPAGLGAVGRPQGPCGHREMHSLVAGGVESARGRWQWQASLRLRRRHRCGGSLLSPCWALSAAHCFGVGEHSYPSEWTVQLGELTSRPPVWNLRTRRNRYKVQDIIVNPGAFGVIHNDIALLRLASSVAYNAHVQPICVESSTFIFLHQRDCWVTGWGFIGSNGTRLPPLYKLQEAQVTILNNTNYLFEQPSSRGMIQDSMFYGSVDTCKVSVDPWSVTRMDCGQPNRPGVYTNISVYFHWIRRVMSHSTPRPSPSQLLLLLALLWAP